jgi:hypothetical protein
MSLDIRNPSVAGEMAKAASEFDIRQAFDMYGGGH